MASVDAAATSAVPCSDSNTLRTTSSTTSSGTIVMVASPSVSLSRRARTSIRATRSLSHGRIAKEIARVYTALLEQPVERVDPDGQRRHSAERDRRAEGGALPKATSVARPLAGRPSLATPEMTSSPEVLPTAPGNRRAGPSRRSLSRGLPAPGSRARRRGSAPAHRAFAPRPIQGRMARPPAERRARAARASGRRSETPCHGGEAEIELDEAGREVDADEGRPRHRGAGGPEQGEARGGRGRAAQVEWLVPAEARTRQQEEGDPEDEEVDPGDPAQGVESEASARATEHGHTPAARVGTTGRGLAGRRRSSCQGLLTLRRSGIPRPVQRRVEA